MAQATARNQTLMIASGSLVAALILIIGRSSQSWNTLRGDESLLLSEAVEDGLAATLRSFGGYLHVVQRAMAWVASLFPPELFPQVLYVITLSFWIVNLALLGYSLQGLTRRVTIWAIAPLAAILPPLGIEVMGDLVHIQVAMFLGIAAVVLFSSFPDSSILLHGFGVYVLLFGLSSPSIVLIAIWCFYRHEFPVVGDRDSEVPNRVILRYSLVALLMQLWVTTVQDDRRAEFSFDNFLSGVRFTLHSLLPQPYRDYYFSFDGSSNAPLNSFLLFVLLAILISLVVGAFRAIRANSPSGRIADAMAFSIAATLFYTTISSDYHTGYVVALYVFLTTGALWVVIQGRGLLRITSVVLLATLLIGSIQSFSPRNDDDIFFGAGGWLYEELVPWDKALAEARRACAEVPERDVFIATNRVDTFWGVTMSCEELE